MSSTGEVDQLFNALPEPEKAALQDIAKVLRLDVLEWLNQTPSRISGKKGHVTRLNASTDYSVYNPDAPVGWKENGQPDYDDQISYHDNPRLNALPESIGNLERLETLSLRWNELAELPASMAQLEHLRELNLHHNKFRAITPGITSIASLEVLDMRYNPVVSIPPAISGLSNLKALTLGYWPTFGEGYKNVLRFPPELGKLERLETLRVNEVPHIAFPPEIGNLASLSRLELWGSGIVEAVALLEHLGAWEITILLESMSYHVDRLVPVAYSVDDAADATIIQIQVPPPDVCSVEARGNPSKYQWVTISGKTTRAGAGSRKPVTITAPSSDFSSSYVAIPLTGIENAYRTDVQREEHQILITIKTKKTGS